MSKAKIIIEWNGKRYRFNANKSCHSKRDCDLFQRGVCDNYYDSKCLPCDAICDVFVAICGSCPKFCYKEVKSK